MQSEAVFVIQDIPGKGKGVVAARAISSGELVLLEAPLFTQSLKTSNSTILAAISTLTEEEQRGYFALTNCHRGRLPPALGTFNTNALPCGDNSSALGYSASEAGVFILGSRFNSSCVPNVNNYWDDRLRKIAFYAIKDVENGEELCISYCNLLAAQETRKRELKGKFRFDCTCSACSPTGQELKVSDERRTQLGQLYHEVPGCVNNPSLGVKKVKTALKLLKEEGILEYHEDSFLYDAFQFCAAVSDIANAKSWVKKSWEAQCRARGPNSNEAKMRPKRWKDMFEIPGLIWHSECRLCKNSRVQILKSVLSLVVLRVFRLEKREDVMVETDTHSRYGI